MNLNELTPDIALAELLDKKISVQVSATKSVPVRCYADGAQPNKDLGDEYVNILWNGSATARASQLGCMNGSLALVVLVKTQSNGTVKRNRVNNILAQCQQLASGVSNNGFFFKINPFQVITPTTTNLTTGYSTTIINVEWREL